MRVAVGLSMRQRILIALGAADALSVGTIVILTSGTHDVDRRLDVAASMPDKVLKILRGLRREGAVVDDEDGRWRMVAA